MMAYKKSRHFLKIGFFIGNENYKLTSNTDFSCNLYYRYVRSLLAKTTACLKLTDSLK